MPASSGGSSSSALNASMTRCELLLGAQKNNVGCLEAEELWRWQKRRRRSTSYKRSLELQDAHVQYAYLDVLDLNKNEYAEAHQEVDRALSGLMAF